MSQSTDAILFYGYCWDDEYDYEGDEFPDEVHEASEPVQADFHCSDGCPIPYIFITASRTVASRGYPEKVYVNELHAEHDWDIQLDQFCARFDLTPPDNQQPQWWLV